MFTDTEEGAPRSIKSQGRGAGIPPGKRVRFPQEGGAGKGALRPPRAQRPLPSRHPELPSLPFPAVSFATSQRVTPARRVPGRCQTRGAPSGPMCPLPLAAAAVTAPRTPLRLLGRGLAAAMSTARPLKSVDYEVFGRVQGRGPSYSGRSKRCWGGRIESCDKHSPSLGAPAPLWLGLPPGHDTARAGGKETEGACAGELGWRGRRAETP